MISHILLIVGKINPSVLASQNQSTDGSIHATASSIHTTADSVQASMDSIHSTVYIPLQAVYFQNPLWVVVYSTSEHMLLHFHLLKFYHPMTLVFTVQRKG